MGNIPTDLKESKMKKTVVIWDSCGEVPIQFFVIEDKDISHLDGIYVNTYYEDPDDPRHAYDTEVSLLMYDEAGVVVVNFIPKEEAAQHIREGAGLIVCGFLP